MRKTRTINPDTIFTKRLAILFFFTILLLLSPKSVLAKDSAGMNWKAVAEVKTTYTSNVFNLSKAQQSGLEANSADDRTSGRYNDMEHVSDLIVSPAIKLNLKTPGLSGNNLKLQTSLTYNQYLLNSKKSYPRFDFEVEQGLGSGNSIGFDFAYKFDVFKKNYLSDADDGGVGATVTPDERVYTPGTYNSMVGDIIYSHTLMKNSKGTTAGYYDIKKVVGSVLVGMEKIDFDAPFDIKNSDTLRLGAGVNFALRSKTGIKLSYLYESKDVPIASEVLIRDEDDFNVDLNADGDSLDQDVRTIQTVNRSRKDHSFKIKATKKFENRWVGHAIYELRLQHYDSKETFDVTRIDRKDTRHTIGFGLDRKYGEKLSMELDWKYVTEDANRAGLGSIGEAEQKPFNKHVLSLVVAYKL